MNLSPYVIGYWAKTHGLQWDDVADEEWFKSAMAAFDDANEVAGSFDADDEFKAGWNKADEEIKEEKRAAAIEELKSSLREAYSAG